jgi:hypothetical protein
MDRVAEAVESSMRSANAALGSARVGLRRRLPDERLARRVRDHPVRGHVEARKLIIGRDGRLTATT